MKTADVVVIGGGVIGNAIAYYCAKEGLSVILIEQQDILNGTSSACDTAIHLQSKNPGIHLDMALSCIQKYPLLQKEFDIDIHFKKTGTMLAIENEEQLKLMQQFVQRQQAAGLNVQILGQKETIKRQPAMKNGQIIGSTYYDQDATIHPQNLTKAYCRAAQKQGVHYELYNEVIGFKTSAKKVTGVISKGGEILCNSIVNACGAFAPLLGSWLGINIPIMPRRGQILVTEPVPKFITTICNDSKYITAKYRPELLGTGIEAQLGIGLSLTQTDRGNLLIGGTREFVGYDTRTTHQGIKLVAAHAAKILPALQELSIIRTFAGLRPFTPDGLPIISKVPGWEGLYVAGGHEGDGLALSAITGEIVSEMLANKPISSEIDISRLSLERFCS